MANRLKIKIHYHYKIAHSFRVGWLNCTHIRKKKIIFFLSFLNEGYGLMAIMYLTHDVVNELLTINRFHHHQQQISSHYIQDTWLKPSSIQYTILILFILSYQRLWLLFSWYTMPSYSVWPEPSIKHKNILGNYLSTVYKSSISHILLCGFFFYLFCFHKHFTFAALAGGTACFVFFLECLEKM